MFKLVVLSVLLAVVSARPGYLHAPAVAYSAHVPVAVSHQSRVDVHSAPLVATYHAPAVVAAPILAAPAVHAVHAYPAAVSHTSRFDVHKSAAIIGTPFIHGYAAHVPAVHAW